jgi:hypothetical protein
MIISVLIKVIILVQPCFNSPLNALSSVYSLLFSHKEINSRLLHGSTTGSHRFPMETSGNRWLYGADVRHCGPVKVMGVYWRWQETNGELSGLDPLKSNGQQ